MSNIAEAMVDSPMKKKQEAIKFSIPQTSKKNDKYTVIKVSIRYGSCTHWKWRLN